MESTTGLASPARSRASTAALPTSMLISPPADGATNMALDEALLLHAGRTGTTIYRVYGWSRPTVSLGRNQAARGWYDLDLAESRGIEFVRRPTGGRAILHHREITYAVAGPVSGFGSLGESYRRINRLLLEALRTLGVDGHEATAAGRAPSPGVAPCFESPVAGELVAGGRKLVGSAQVRDGDAFLQHGSILVDDDQHLLNELLHDHETSPPPATLRALTGRAVTIDDFANALAQALRTHGGIAPMPLEPDQGLLSDVQSLIRTRYAVADWTWRL